MKSLLIAAASLLAVLSASDAAQAKGRHLHKHASGPAHHALSGWATYYGGSDGFCGKRTAYGGTLDCSKLTAAHRSLPFGTILNVRNVKTGRSVQVEITDRGPFTSAFIDLSPAAAKQMGGLTSHYGLVAEVVTMGTGAVSAENDNRRGAKTRLAKAGKPSGVQVASAGGPLQLASFLSVGGEDPMRPASIFGAQASAKPAKKTHRGR